MIKINSFESPGCGGCDISSTFDGFAEYGFHQSCQADHEWKKGKAYFSIPYSLVTHYILLVDHFDEYYQGCAHWGVCDYFYDYDDDAKLKVEVCNKVKGTCEPCEELRHESRSRTKRSCGHDSQGVEGNEIRITKPDIAPRVCEFEIHGIGDYNCISSVMLRG